MRKLCVVMLLAVASVRLFAQQSTVRQGLSGVVHASLPLPAAQASQVATSPFIRQIDHIIIVSEHPESLFHLFSEQLELPLGFPFKSYGTFSSGGVGFGNVVVEFIHLPESHPGVTGVALEPATIEEAYVALDARGVKHDAPHPTYQPDPGGGQRLGWTTIELHLPVEGFFLCKYNNSVEPRRTRIRQELDARKGGPLGIDSVLEVVVGVRDVAAAQAQFRNLLGPPGQGETSVWSLGAGPAIRLITDTQDHLKEVRVKVHSLEKARAYLKDQGLLGADSGHELTINSARLGETNLVLLQ